jgi:DNA-binding NarL/FixJ family response regulator
MAAPASKGPLTIYLAEDHIAIRELLVAHLRMQPAYSVIGQTDDGRQVVEDCTRLKPRLLILDLGLPGLNGVEVARALTKAVPQTHILIFTSHHDAATVRQVLEAGARGMVEKSAPFDQLVKAIEAVSAGRAFFGDAVTASLQRSFSDPVATRTVDNLTTREREVLQLVAEGLSNKEISSRLGISVKTAENHRHNLMRKLGAHNGSDLTREAYRLGLLRADRAPSSD